MQRMASLILTMSVSLDGYVAPADGSTGWIAAGGSADGLSWTVETGLIDEYRLMVHPVVLGAGERLFSAPLAIEPVSTTAFSGGAVAHVFTARP
jgi:riboflavin biosynthesis pyrimidine reductase